MSDASLDSETEHPISYRHIDRSTRFPVLAFTVSAVGWLIVHGLLAAISSHQTHVPELFADWEFLTHGRLHAAQFALLTYGWGSMSGIAIMLWLQARLAGVPLVLPGVGVLAAGIWNICVLAGLGAILSGSGTGVAWLEFPFAINMGLVTAMLLIAVPVLATFVQRKPGHVYVSQWYLFGACLWLPIMFVIANIAIHKSGIHGVVQASAHWWFAHNMMTLWFTPLALAALYYFLPKVSGRPIASYSLSLLGFWTLAIFATWAGAAQLVGGPVPAWLATVGVTASVLMLVPVITVGLNHHLTLAGEFGLLRNSPVLRFLFAGGVAYTLYGVLIAVLALRTVAETTQFTIALPGHISLGLYGFASLTFFGSLYYIIPRLTGRAWHNAGWISGTSGVFC